MDKIGNFFGETYRNVAKNVMGVLKESKFYSDGVLTPEEFVLAGDFLVQKCPTWKWVGGKNSKIKHVDYLPEEKQYLITNVPCPRRAQDYEKSTRTSEKINEDDWIEPQTDIYKRKEKDNQPIDFENNENNSNGNNKLIVDNTGISAGIEIEGMEIQAENNPNENNENANEQFDFEVVENDDDNVIRTRTYDVSVTYDYYYRVPRMWLTGYDENGIPLEDEKVKEDIMLEYIDKTVSIENHPHTSVNSISIHPCKHSILLLKMIENYENAGKKLEVHMSILLFLKFLHSVVPTIEYDFTMDINLM